MFSYYNIPIQYVRIKPDLANGYAAMVMITGKPPVAGRTALENWMRGAAAGKVAQRHCLHGGVPEEAGLIAEFSLAASDVTENPDHPHHDDMRNFASLGLRRDQEIGETDSGGTGPASWVPVWLETERLIRGELWPAVEAIVEKLFAMAKGNDGKDIENLPDLSGEEAAAIASKAMKELS